MTETFNIRKEEYLALHKEIESGLLDLTNLERNCVLGVAAAYAWAATATSPSISQTAWLVPIALPLYGAIKTFAIGTHLGNIGSYLKTVEKKAYAEGSNDGWEHYLAENGARPQTTTRLVVWATFFLFTVLCSARGYDLSHGMTTIAPASPSPSASQGGK